MIIDCDFPQVQLVEIEEASKIDASNKGDKLASGDIRIYLDADIEIEEKVIRGTASMLVANAQAIAAAPRVVMNLEKSSLLIRMYYHLWRLLPYVTDGLICAGFYGLNAVGRARFKEFPAVIENDEFLRRNFKLLERISIPEHTFTFTITPSSRLQDLIRVKTRV